MPDEEEFDGKVQSMRPPKDVPPQMAYLYEWPLLTKEQEQHLFRKMNFLKHTLHKLQERIDPAQARVPDLQQIEELQQRDQGGPRPAHQLQPAAGAQHRQASTSTPGQNLDELMSRTATCR